MIDPDELPNAVAIVGMAARLPGADDVDQLWRNLSTGTESVTRFADSELLAAGVPAQTLREPSYVRARATLADIDMFDSALFDIPPREADLMDPQHRLMLEVAFHALEDAGYASGTARFRTDIYAGAGYNGYLQHVVLAHDGDLDPYQVSLGNELSYLSTRIAYKLDLRGAAVNVDTACSTGLVAAHLGCQSLLTGQCDMAVAGASGVTVPHHRGYLYRPGGILSADGHCRTFDAAASGFVEGSGAAAVILRRLSDAVRDGDRIRAVILGSAINNDGSGKIGFSAPSVQAQGEVVREAIALAEVSVDEISYVETHGTATHLGDPIEVAALGEAFAERSPAAPPCLLGSIKTNIGHLGAPAGLAGLIKVVLALENEAIPPSLHYRTPNPEIDFGGSRFAVADRLVPWERGDRPRLAGVTSLGMGGTNAHVVVAEAPVPDRAAADEGGVHLLAVAAHDDVALDEACRALADRVAAADDLADIAYTLAVGRKPMPARAVAVCRGDSRTAPGSFDPRGGLMTGHAAQRSPVLAFLFPGQGAQRLGMAGRLYRQVASFRGHVDSCAKLLEAPLGMDIRAVLDPGSGVDVDQTWLTQPALFTVTYALAHTLIDWGVQPDAMLGNSIGEYVAAVLAGVFDLGDGLRLVARRGRLVQDLPPGAMLMVDRPAAQALDDLPDGLDVAVAVAAGRCVVAGAVPLIGRVEETLTSRGVRCRPIATSHAFHSAMMWPAAEALAQAAAQVPRQPPTRRYVSNVTGTWITPEQAVDPAYWARHLTSTVRLSDGMTRLHEDGTQAFVEAGPGRGMVSAAANNPGLGSPLLIPAMPLDQENESEDESLARAVGRLWLAGAAINWPAYYAGASHRRTGLPLYPYRRRRHWLTGARRPEAAGLLEPAAAVPVGDHGDQLRTILADISGLAAAEIDSDTSLILQGFDSILLLNLSHTVHRRYGLQIGLGRLFDELATPAALARFLSKNAGPAVPARELTASAAPSGERQIGAARGGVDLDTGPSAALADLTARYTARTGASRTYIGRHRRWHADSRDSAAFTSSWKSLCYPIVARSSAGARFIDVDGNEYIDVAMGFGVHLLGHQPPVVDAAVRRQLARGFHLGPQSDLAPGVARSLCEMTGSERAAFTNSGTEAVMTALRLARAATGRRTVVIFSGSYHGTFDGTLARAVRGRYGARLVGPPGTPPGMVSDLMVLEYAAAEALGTIAEHVGDIAAILVEPVQSRRPGRQDIGFLRRLRDVATDGGAALVFDEIITGFRIAPGGAQEWSGISADLVTYGKVLGGGLPVGVVAGREPYFDAIDGVGTPRTVFAGTFSKNPLAMAAVGAVLGHLGERGPGLQRELNERTAALVGELNAFFDAEQMPMRLVHFGSLFTFEFDPGTLTADLFFYRLVLEGVYVWEGRTCFLSTAHTADDIAEIARAVRLAATELRGVGLLPQRTDASPARASGRSSDSPADG